MPASTASTQAPMVRQRLGVTVAAGTGGSVVTFAGGVATGGVGGVTAGVVGSAGSAAAAGAAAAAGVSDAGAAGAALAGFRPLDAFEAAADVAGFADVERRRVLRRDGVGAGWAWPSSALGSSAESATSTSVSLVNRPIARLP